MDESERGAWLAIIRVPGIGAQRTRRLLEHFGDLHQAWTATAGSLVASGLDRRAVDQLIAARGAYDPRRDLDRLETLGATALTWRDPEYPAPLLAVVDAPPVLFVRGRLDALLAPSVAIVGTRRATGYGREQSERFATDLVRAGWVVASGLARGVDTYAHRGAVAALSASGADRPGTVAVMGHGIDTVYPPENARLAAQIIECGALVSDYPLGVGPAADHFPARNRIISGLSLGTLVIEAPPGSGALITTTYANDQGRQVYALPGPVSSPASEGCHRLIKQGARLVTSAEDIVIDLLPSLAMMGRPIPSRQGPLSPTGRTVDRQRPQLAINFEERDQGEENVSGGPGSAVIQVLRDASRPMHVDEIARAAQISSSEIAGLLMMLELDGWVRDDGSLEYSLARHPD